MDAATAIPAAGPNRVGRRAAAQKARRTGAPTKLLNPEQLAEDYQARRATVPLEDVLLDTVQLAAWLQCTRQWLEKMRIAGDTGPPFMKLGRMVRYRRGDVLTWLEGCAR